VIGQWKCRDGATVIRMILAFTDTQWVDKFYVQGDGPKYSQDEWLKDRFQLGLDFPSLPYFCDGLVKLTHSSAIVTYLGRKLRLYGATEVEAAHVDMLLHECHELRASIVSLVYNSKYNDLKKKFFEGFLPNTLLPLEHFLSSKTWFTGSNLTIADFVLYEIFDLLRLMESKSLEPFPKIRSFTSRFESLPRIEAFFKSDRYFKRPFFNSNAAFR